MSVDGYGYWTVADADPLNRLFVRCVAAPHLSEVGAQGWVHWTRLTRIAGPIPPQPPAYLVKHAATVGIAEPESFRWIYAGVVEDRSVCLSRCPHSQVGPVIFDTPDLSRRQMEAMHAQGWPVARPRIAPSP